MMRGVRREKGPFFLPLFFWESDLAAPKGLNQVPSLKRLLPPSRVKWLELASRVAVIFCSWDQREE